MPDQYTRLAVSAVFTNFVLTMGILQLKDIEKSYGPVQVLRGISLDIPASRITAIVGPSGAGKSTLLHIMGTLDTPDSGQVILDSQRVDTLSPKQTATLRNLRLGFIFQDHRLLPEFSILENVMLPALIARVPARQARAKATGLLDTLGLAHRLDHRPAQLSGGECQRAAVARALVNDPALILADEPTGSLDTANRNNLQQIFARLCTRQGTTIVTVTHDPQLADIADNTIRIADGRITNITAH